MANWPATKKYQSYDEVERTKVKSARFLRDVLGDDARADAVEEESPEDFAARKRIVITNNSVKRRMNVANGNNAPTTKAFLEDCIDKAIQILTESYTPESSREDLAGAVGDALAVLEGDVGDEEEDDDDSGDDDSR